MQAFPTASTPRDATPPRHRALSRVKSSCGRARSFHGTRESLSAGGDAFYILPRWEPRRAGAGRAVGRTHGGRLRPEPAHAAPASSPRAAPAARSALLVRAPLLGSCACWWMHVEGAWAVRARATQLGRQCSVGHLQTQSARWSRRAGARGWGAGGLCDTCACRGARHSARQSLPRRPQGAAGTQRDSPGGRARACCDRVSTLQNVH